tara:strand:- start:5959 stop:6216 length:258 start_codon:yes stop_codon:yes gene_type:complete
MKAEEMTIQEIKKAIDAYDKLKTAGVGYREKYRNTQNGKKKHNECSKRSYYRRKLRALEGIEELSERQLKYKAKWEAGLAALPAI